jgi:DNA gyrase subunit A
MTEGSTSPEPAPNRIINRPIEIEMRKAYIDYAMSVIVGRALPDVRDGLKPVHRKILFGMNELGANAGRAYKKSARIVGEVLGKYHPHGDIAIYDALVRMAQTFSMRYPLIDGQGNFGSVDGDTAAAMRYTECRLSKIAEEMLQDIEKETVRMVDNFDATLREPEVLPSKFPNLLVNGSSGIAVGMATNMPPHNLREIVDGMKHLIDNPEADLSQLMQFIKGPDFPTGGTVYGLSGLVDAYTSGRGRITVRAKTHLEEEEGRKKIIVDEIPYQVNKSAMLEDIARLVKEKRVEGISDLRDESDRSGMRIVIELKRDAIEDVVLNQLFTHSQMETTFSIINIALVNNEPRLLSLRELMQNFIGFRREIVRRRTEFELKQARARMHIVEGLMVAIENIDRMIDIIKKSSSGDEAKQRLMGVADWAAVPLKHRPEQTKGFNLSEEQAKAILDMRLQKLTGLEMDGVRAEYSELIARIDDYTRTLGDETRILAIIKAELDEIREKYGDDRLTEINSEGLEMSIEDLIPDEEVVVTVTNRGYVKRVPLATYEQQHRGGKGLAGVDTHEEDYVVDMFVASTHNYILFITNRGRAYWLKTYAIPPGSRHSPGRPIVNLLPRLEEGERVIDNIPLKSFDEGHYLLFATRRGKVKKTSLMAYSHVRAMGIIAVGLEDGDEVIGTVLTDASQDVILATRNGYAIRFGERDVRPMGRQAGGVRGIRLREGDEVVSMECSSSEGNVLLTVTENGYGKPSWVGEYRKMRRGGKGVITIKTTDRNGKVVAVKAFNPGDEVLLTSESGMVIRVPIDDIRVMGRNTQGVSIMKLESGDRVTAVTRLVGSEMEERVMKEGEQEEMMKKKLSREPPADTKHIPDSKLIEPKERETDE